MAKTHEEIALCTEEIQMPVADGVLKGCIWLPPCARGVVVFPNGRGIGRDAADTLVAGKLRKGGLGTVFVELLTSKEGNLDARTAAFRFDVSFLTSRLVAFTTWLVHQPSMHGLHLGYFGTGYGAIAAVRASTNLPSSVAAIVANDSLLEDLQQGLKRVAAPTLVLGGHDHVPMEESVLRAGHQVVVLTGSHIQEDIARLTTNWFAAHLFFASMASGKTRFRRSHAALRACTA